MKNFLGMKNIFGFNAATSLSLVGLVVILTGQTAWADDKGLRQVTGSINYVEANAIVIEDGQFKVDNNVPVHIGKGRLSSASLTRGMQVKANYTVGPNYEKAITEIWVLKSN